MATPRDLDEVFETAAAGHVPAIAIFPSIRTEVALVDQLKGLNAGERWSVARQTVKGLVTDDLLVGMQWITAGGDKSTPMGFGPFATMPVTRRAPYVCVATWPGAHENPHTHRRKPLAGAVDFLDAALPDPLTKEEFDARWDRSVERTAELLHETNDSPRYYRNVAFRLSPAAAAAFEAS